MNSLVNRFVTFSIQIASVKGAVEFLKGVGFERLEEEVPDAGAGEEKVKEPVLVLPAEKSLSPDHLAECRETLQNAEAIRPTLYRNTTVYCVSTCQNSTRMLVVLCTFDYF